MGPIDFVLTQARHYFVEDAPENFARAIAERVGAGIGHLTRIAVPGA